MKPFSLSIVKEYLKWVPHWFGKDTPTLNSAVAIDSLREQLGINKSAVQRLLTSLKEKGYIEARDNEGGWRVLITPSV